ncbi:hypothetical protein QTP88_002286 [Uroleucon formosanum]
MVVIVRSGLSLRSVVVPQSISSLVLITRLTRILLEIYELVVIKYRVLTQAIKPKIAEWRDLEALYFFPKLNAPAVFSTSAFESRRLDKNKVFAEDHTAMINSADFAVFPMARLIQYYYEVRRRVNRSAMISFLQSHARPSVRLRKFFPPQSKTRDYMLCFPRNCICKCNIAPPWLSDAIVYALKEFY